MIPSQEARSGNGLHGANQTYTSNGDAVRGDKVLEDKFSGDKIGGDKIVYTRSLVDELEEYINKAVSKFETRLFHFLRPHPAPMHPYKFLYPYTIEDANIFFGRQNAVEELNEVVLRNRLTIFHGPSGSGKSSLVNAGLFPKLIENCRLPVYARAYEDPTMAIKQAIALPSFGPWPALLRDLSLYEFLGLVTNFISRQVKDLVIILDQFEEFFIFPPHEAIQQPFIADLARCVYERELPVRFVITVRKDYYSDLAAFNKQLPTIFFNEYRLEHMKREEAKSAVTGPLSLRKETLSFEPEFLDRLLDDPDRGGFELPHLQIICTKLFDAAVGEDKQISFDLYQKLGRSDGILGNYLTNELKKLPGQKSEISRHILKELVSSESTRRVLSYMALATSTQCRFNCDQEEFEDVLNRLVNARLLHRWDLEGKICYEMAHEYLITEISQWIDHEELAFKQVDELLARELITWRVHGVLIPNERLALLLPQRDKFKDADHEARYLFYLSALYHRSTDASLWAMEALGQLGDSRAIEPLISVLRDNYGSARNGAARALGQIGPKAVPHLLAILGDENVYIRSAAAEALATIGEPATDRLIDALASPDVSVRISAAKTLGQMEYRQAVKPLIAALNDTDVTVRYLAAGALGRLRDKNAVLPLIECLKDDDWHVRDRAAKALGMIDDGRVVASLVALLGDNDARVRQRASEALENQKESAVLPIIEALKNSDSRLRRGAATALGSMGSNEAVLPLKNALHDNDEEVRRNAAESLGRLENLRVDLLICDLQDEDWEVRRHAAIALGELRNVESIGPLIHALTDTDWRVRIAAAISLGHFGEASLEPLQTALRYNKSIINKSLAFTLRMIGTPEALALLNDFGFEN